jgi:hypothetical protein
MRTFAFKTLGREIRLSGNIEVGQTVAYRRERESISTILTDNHFSSPYELTPSAVWLTVPTVGILGMVY